MLYLLVLPIFFELFLAFGLVKIQVHGFFSGWTFVSRFDIERYDGLRWKDAFLWLFWVCQSFGLLDNLFHLPLCLDFCIQFHILFFQNLLF